MRGSGKRSAQLSSPRGRELRGSAGERPCSPPLFEHRDFVCEPASVRRETRVLAGLAVMEDGKWKRSRSSKAHALAEGAVVAPEALVQRAEEWWVAGGDGR